MAFTYSGRHHVHPIADAMALELEQLVVNYPGSPEPALDHVSLKIASGLRVALVGANGSGKSTLLKTVAGLLHPQAGTIRIYGHPVGACHHRVTYLPQRGDVDWRFPVSVKQMVLAGRYVHLGWLRRTGPNDRAMVMQVLERLGLEELAERQISQLSGGQQQRALLARALVQEADLLLLDEPLSAVDAPSRAIIAGVLADLRRENRTALVATHHLDRLDDEFDRVISLENGSLQTDRVIEETGRRLAPAKAPRYDQLATRTI
ncbi:ABC transporter ATP-binding protein [Candidatus Chloroploca sp. M-50]|uniref:ABC transporter ATP-binding protein n=1 Tax=Candidatus Chloroploca mongolica TaxID=2528176 RepID=A0ABS4DHR9_9CHLR|nr:ABC transporter ATP-binding protein [Candidatus Chloroploca mongolica]MBP1468970.1 ABC transporter ATP-binding protein [Candidatus Chloroploca mongolica]